MERKNSLKTLAAIYAVGIIGHLIPFTRVFMKYLTAPVLLITFLYIVYTLRKEIKPKVITVFLISYLLTFIVEAVGVATGSIFGEYTYGTVLGIQLFKTPLLIGLLWVFVVWGSYQLNEYFVKNKHLRVLFTGITVILFDILLEPVAITLGYWSWSGGGIPLQNYLAWGIIGIIVASLFAYTNIKIKNKVLSYFFVIQFIFFAILGVLL